MNVTHTIPRNKDRVTLSHANDHELRLLVHHASGDAPRLQTDESSYSPARVDDTTTLFTLPANAFDYRIGRSVLEIETSEGITQVVLDLLARSPLAEYAKPLIKALADSSLALLAMPRTISRLDQNAEHQDRVENLVQAARLFTEATQLLATNPPTRINELVAETPPGTRLTAGIVQAITYQPYALRPTPPGPHTLPIRGRHYTATSMHAPVPREDTDTPANRFVHGVGLALERLANEVLDDLSNHHVALSSTSSSMPGYLSIRQLTQNETLKLVAQRVHAVENVLISVRRDRAHLDRRVPVQDIHKQLSVSPRVLMDSRYARVRRTLDLLRAPAADHYGPQGLIAGITSLTTLYELYCLALTHDYLLSNGWHLINLDHDPTSGTSYSDHRLESGEPFPNTFRYDHRERGLLQLLYEPRITRAGHTGAGLICVSSSTSFLTPDLVIRSANGIIILDAKFTSDPPTRFIEPSVMKYLHGLEPQDPNMQVLGLHLMHYSPGADPFDFHNRPVTPAITTIPVHPHREDHLRRILDRHLV